MDWFTLVYVLLYWSVLMVFCGYVLIYLAALISPFIIFSSMSFWQVSLKDAEKKKGIVRDMGPFDIVVVGRGGRPAFPVFTPSAQHLTFKGLQGGEPGMRTTTLDDWKMIRAPQKEYKDVIQSRYGWFSPLFVFRKLTFLVTGKHVVRVRAPFFIIGLFDFYEPITSRFTRAKTLKSYSKEERPSMTTVDEVEVVNKMIVTDTSDHILWEFALTTISSDFATKDGYSLHVQVTLVLRVDNVYTIVSWTEWSAQIRIVINNIVNPYIRSGKLKERYALEVNKNELEDLIFDHLSKGELYPMSKGKGGKKLSTMNTLGFLLQSVAIDDIFPASKETKKEIERIMAIAYEGAQKAEAAGKMVTEQANALDGKDDETKRSVVAMTAAGKGSRTDIIIGGGDADRVYRKRTAQNTEEGGQDD